MIQNRFTDPELLRAAVEQYLASPHSAAGIGTQQEKSVHGVLKFLLEPDARYHEQPVGPFVADILNEERIFEIQTGSSFPLIKKLRAYGEATPVTVVKPVFTKNTIRWMEPGTYAIEEKTGRGKRGKTADLLSDMKNLLEFLPRDNFSVLAVLMETEEYRLKDGYGKNGHTHGTKLDKMPVKITADYLFESPQDWAVLFPEGMNTAFTVPELAKAMRLTQFHAYRAIKVFELAGCVKPAGKRGRAALYEPVLTTDSAVTDE